MLICVFLWILPFKSDFKLFLLFIYLSPVYKGYIKNHFFNLNALFVIIMQLNEHINKLRPFHLQIDILSIIKLNFAELNLFDIESID